MFLKKFIKIIFVVSLLGVVVNSSGQILVDRELFSLYEKYDSLEQNFTKPLKEADKETDIIFSVSFLLYKTFISSQDKPSCVFSPTCSEYAVEAFHKKGVIGGWVHTFDRLSRCHGFVNHTHYHFVDDKKLFYDPVE